MTTSLRCVPPPLPVSATYKQEPLPHGATLTSSQLFTWAPEMRTCPIMAPAGSSAITSGASESLSDQSTFGVRRLSARPLASGSDPSGLSCAKVWHVSSAVPLVDETEDDEFDRPATTASQTITIASPTSSAR